MGSGAEAKFTVAYDDQLSPGAKEGARSLEELRAKMLESEAAVKELNTAQRRLKGSSDDVKSAKAALTAKSNALKASITQTQLAMLKQGSSAAELAKKTRDATKAQSAAKEKSDAFGSTLGRIGGPISAVRNHVADLREALKGASSVSGVATIAFAGLAVAVAAVTAAALAGAVSLGKWVLEGANAARTAFLFREAATGSLVSATNLGDQIDVLGRRVSTSKEKLNEMALALAKVRISGRAQVDTLNAVAQASDAMGDDVGNTLKGLVTRSQLTQRMFIGPQELFGTGLEFKDVAAELATQMKVGVKDAQRALMEGRVKLDDGAKALRSAVEKRFGSINARKLLDLNTLATKFREGLQSLTTGVKLDVLLKPLGEMLELFDGSTVTGQALKELVTDFGNGVVGALKDGIPYAKKFIQGIIIGSLEAEIAYLKLRNAIRKTFGDKDALAGVDKLELAMKAGKVAVYAFEGVVLTSYAAVRLLGAAAEGIALPFQKLFNVADDVRKKMGLGWETVGKSIVDGLIAGIVPGGAGVVKAVKDLANKAKLAFTGKDGIDAHSPSKKFEKFGGHIPEGAAKGVERGSDKVSDAAEAMAPVPRRSSAGGGGGGGTVVHVQLAINVDATGGGGQGVADALASPSFKAQFAAMVEEVLLGAGVGMA